MMTKDDRPYPFLKRRLFNGFNLAVVFMILPLLHSLDADADGAPLCFTSITSLKAAFPKYPVLLKLQPLLDSTSFAGSVPTPLGPAAAEASIAYGSDAITLSLHVVDPRPLFPDFRLSNRPESICVQGDQFCFLDGANGKRFNFTVVGSALTIQKDDHVLTMRPVVGGAAASDGTFGRTSGGSR